jgi:peroxiredoxin
MAVFKGFQGDFDEFSYAIVLDSELRKIPLCRFWNQQTAILVFLRHFGCISCRSHAQEVWSQRAELQKNGSRIIFIGNGSPDMIDGFRQAYGLEGALIFTDPTLRSFSLAGFNRSIANLLKFASAKNMISLAMEGHTNGSPFEKGTGSNRQMGGIVVVHPNSQVSYQYISESVGDTPDAEEIPNESIVIESVPNEEDQKNKTK